MKTIINIDHANFLSETELNTLEYHSVLNILNVIVLELQLVNIDLENNNLKNNNLEETVEQIVSLPSKIRLGMKRHKVIEQCREIRDKVSGFMIKNEKFRERVTPVLSIMNERLKELEQSDKWSEYPIDFFIAKYIELFKVVEKNSGGRYSIKFFKQEKRPEDYLMLFDIKSQNGQTITIPSIINDVFRDLLMNARKYTPIGGTISGTLIDDGDLVKIEIKDNGIGIPEDEIEKVVKFGYRASNTNHVKSSGGGFGLTKAYAICKRFDGSMWIESQLGKGTVVTIEFKKR